MLSLQSLIDEALKKEQDERGGRERSGLWSPSSFGRCYRFQFWHRKNEPPSDPLDARTLRKFKAGKLFHDFVQDLLPQPFEVEVRVTKDDILGYADVVFPDSVCDIKSAHTNDFRRFWNKDKEYDIYKEKEPYWLQVACYAWILGKKFCGLFFVGKDDLITAQYQAPTERFIPKLEEELKTLRSAWEADKLPEPCPRAYGGKEGAYCSYRTKCLSMGWDCTKKKGVA